MDDEKREKDMGYESMKDKSLNDNIKHISPKTRERAMVFSENAKKIGLHPGNLRFNSHQDFMSFWFTDGKIYIIAFCSPHGYLFEHYEEVDGVMVANYFSVYNIRHFLFKLKKLELTSFDNYYANLEEEALDAAEVKELVQKYLKEEEGE